MKRLVAALVLAGVAGSAASAPRAESAQECAIAADMAIVARSLAEEEIQKPKAETIMARIYDVGASPRGQALMRDIVVAAYQTGQTRSSQVFAEELLATCIKSGGNMDPILGKRL